MANIQSEKSIFLTELRQEWRALATSRKWLYFLYAILLINLLLPYFRVIEGLIGLRWLQPFSDYIFILVAVLGCFYMFYYKVKNRDLLFLLALILFHHFSAVIHAGTAIYAGRNAGRFIFLCLPLFLVGLTIDKKTSPKLFVGISYLALLCQIPYLYVFGMGSSDSDEIESMGAAYNLLPFACFLIWNAFQRGGLLDIVIALFASFLLVSLGTRGAFACLVFFIAVYLFFFKEYKYSKFTKLLIIAVAGFFIVFSLEFSLIFGGLSSRLGWSTRVYNSIAEGQTFDVAESSGRDVVWKDVLKKLYDNNIFFDANLYVDRLYTGLDNYYDFDRTLSREELRNFNGNIYDQEELDEDEMKLPNSNVRAGLYVHNLELELLCDFGLFGGAIVILLLFRFILKAFRCARDTNITIMLLVFFTASIMQLQFSNSFLQAPVFWFFMGMCVASIRSAKKKPVIG